MKRTGPTNLFLRKLINKLKKASKDSKIWGDVAYYLSKPTRDRPHVNLIKIERIAKDGDIIIVPGKLLAGGYINKKLTIVYWKASNSAIEKAKKAGVELYTIEEYLNKNPKGSNTKIII